MHRNATTITTDELAAVLALKDAYQGSKFRNIVNALDQDLDGSLNLEEVVEVMPYEVASYQSVYD